MDQTWDQLVDHVLNTDLATPANQGLPDLNESRSWNDRFLDMVAFWFERARTSQAPIVEKMVLFWHGHFCSSMEKVSYHKMMFDQNQIFRTEGLGNFETLTQKVSIDPAMLRYLDNFQNRKGSPNENFARELMELFTLGVGNYSEDDVRESARAWTGHGLDNQQYAFNANRHDNESKTFFGVTQNWDGPDIVSHIINGPKQQIVARFIAKKLWSFLAYPNPADSIVNAIASSFVSSGMNIKELVRAIVMRPEFVSTQAKQGLIKSPIEFAISAMIQTGLTAAETNPQWSLRSMGQHPFYPPNVSGWKQNGYWVSASSVWAKTQFASQLRWALFSNGELADVADKPVSDAVNDALEFYGLRNVSSSTRDALHTYVTAERQTSNWAQRAGLLMLPLLTPEFQLA